MKTKADLQERFQRNLDRVRSLIVLYSSLAGTGKGRASVEATDTLRAAVVLIHASMEDLLRSVARIRLPAAKPDIPLVGSKDSRQTKFGLRSFLHFEARPSTKSSRSPSTHFWNDGASIISARS